MTTQQKMKVFNKGYGGIDIYRHPKPTDESIDSEDDSLSEDKDTLFKSDQQEGFLKVLKDRINNFQRTQEVVNIEQKLKSREDKTTNDIKSQIGVSSNLQRYYSALLDKNMKNNMPSITIDSQNTTNTQRGHLISSNSYIIIRILKKIDKVAENVAISYPQNFFTK